MHNPIIGERLRHNTQRLSYTLDMYPTIQSIINGGGGYNNADYLHRDHFHEGCITGIDLTSVEIPDDRVIISWNLMTSGRGSVKGKKRFWALSTRDNSTGRELSLYHRLHTSFDPSMNQGKDNFYTLLFGNCTRDIDKTNFCMEEVTEEDREIFRGAVSWIKHGGGVSFFNEGVKSSELVDFFGDYVGYNEATATAADVSFVQTYSNFTSHGCYCCV